MLKAAEINENHFTVEITNDGLHLDFQNLNLDDFSLPRPSTSASSACEPELIPCLNIVILIVGSRGDVQPFIALGKGLKQFGHRVRIATHEIFRSFVTENGLGFYPLAGNPEELMAFMVKNPGLIPGPDSIMKGEIQKKRKVMAEILNSTWLACTEPDEDGAFEADAIIANPPSFGHIHCAEKLGIPLHIYFTMPWTATRDFPHPLTSVRRSKDRSESEIGMINYLSYDVTDTLQWAGLGDVINKFRHKIGLTGISVGVARKMMKELRVPHTYCWSPALIPKPYDWPSYIDVCGFFFLDLATNYEPTKEINDFLNSGPSPIYIGFGSIVIDDSQATTKLLYDAISKSGVRAIISRGWSSLGDDNPPSNILLIDNCPHDWLFRHVSAVCHHGGAGTTAQGLLNGKPTIVVPFFGDQPFWGSMVSRMNVGPDPIPFKELSVERLTRAIQFCLSPDVVKNASALGMQMRDEDGVSRGVQSFHKCLPLSDMICDVVETQLARFFVPKKSIKISEFAASVLIESGCLSKHDIVPYKPVHWLVQRDDLDLIDSIITGGHSLSINTAKGVAGVVKGTFKPIYDILNPNKKVSAKNIAKGFAKGVATGIYYPVKGSWKFLGNISSGLRNTPAAFDDDEIIKPRKKVSNFSEGALEGSLSFVHGIVDGLTDFFVKPYQGAKKSRSIKGFGKGLSLGAVSLISKPASGGIEFVYQTGRGTVASGKRILGRGGKKLLKPESPQEHHTVPLFLRQQIVERFQDL